MQREEIVLILSAGHPLASKAVDKPGFKHPWIDLSLFSRENFILLYPDQNTGGIALKLFKDYGMDLPYCCTHATARCPSNWPWKAWDCICAGKLLSYGRIPCSHPSLCLSIGKCPIVTTTIAAYPKGRYLPQHARDYMEIIREYCARKL